MAYKTWALPVDYVGNYLVFSTAESGERLMSELDLMRMIAQSPKVLHEIYGDLAKPGVQQAGKALGTIIGLGNTALWPVALLNERTSIALKQNLGKYREKLQDTPEEEVCEVAPEVGVPIAEKISYVTNEDLSEMYTELLAKASQLKHANAAHPSFVKIIDSISPDEAMLMKEIRKSSAIPFISVRFYKKGTNQWIELHPMMLQLRCLVQLAYQNNVPAYFSNLEGLGIVDIQNDTYLAQDDLYEPLEELARSTYSQAVFQITERELRCNRGRIEITSFGRLFLHACFSTNRPE